MRGASRVLTSPTLNLTTCLAMAFGGHGPHELLLIVLLVRIPLLNDLLLKLDDLRRLRFK